MDTNPDLISVTPSKHLPKGEMDQVVIDKSSLNDIVGSHQQGAHGLVVSVNTNATTLQKIKDYSEYKKKTSQIITQYCLKFLL